jgi:hypothetical protein
LIGFRRLDFFGHFFCQEKKWLLKQTVDFFKGQESNKTLSKSLQQFLFIKDYLPFSKDFQINQNSKNHIFL